MVALVGVWKRGWTLAQQAGTAPLAPIDSAVRAVGRIVVWVDAAAEVRIAMIRSLSSGEPEDLRGERREDVALTLVGEEGRARAAPARRS